LITLQFQSKSKEGIMWCMTNWRVESSSILSKTQT
jgi:hypothetical protein